MQFSCMSKENNFDRKLCIMDIVIRYFSASFFIIYMLVAFILPCIRNYKRTGINPITFGNTDNVHDYIGKWFKIILAMIPVAIILYWLDYKLYDHLSPIKLLAIPMANWAGIFLCTISLIWTVAAQYQMGNSWRIGIDEKYNTNLITTGLFSISRNPIFLGMQMTLIGFFLLLPNAITLLVMTSGCMLIQIQVRIEEEFLIKKHGRIYSQYKKEVSRFI